MEKLTNREKFIIIVDNDVIKKSDAIILLEGDGRYRNKTAIDLYLNKFANKIVFSGGLNDPKSGAFIQYDIIKHLTENLINEEDIIVDRYSMNTRQQAEECMKLVIKYNWKKIILVVSHYHQYRAYLTFLKCMKDMNLLIEIINSPAILKWFDYNDWGTRYNLLDLEFEKIEKYKNHVSSFEDAIEYQKWKELQS